MPELPDVEVFKQYLNRTAIRKKISDVPELDRDLLNGTSVRKMKGSLIGSRFSSTDRYGKYLFAHLGNGKHLIFHFGMTGFLKYFKDKDQTPEHVRLLIEFANGYYLAYDAQRKLGLLGLTDNIDDFIEHKHLGPDWLNSKITFDDFNRMIEKRRGTIKSVLMNQEIMSGLGNVYSDEVLFHSNLHPASRAEKLEQNDFVKIYRMVHRVLDKSIQCQADPGRFPRSYLTPRREEGRACPKCSGKIRKATVSGRASFFCDKHQRKV